LAPGRGANADVAPIQHELGRARDQTVGRQVERSGHRVAAFVSPLVVGGGIGERPTEIAAGHLTDLDKGRRVQSVQGVGR